jgi:hypothetical protein
MQHWITLRHACCTADSVVQLVPKHIPKQVRYYTFPSILQGSSIKG